MSDEEREISFNPIVKTANNSGYSWRVWPIVETRAVKWPLRGLHVFHKAMQHARALVVGRVAGPQWLPSFRRIPTRKKKKEGQKGKSDLAR